MGQENSKIFTKNIVPNQLLRKQPVEVGLYFYPFKQFSSYHYDENDQQVVLRIESPYEDSIKTKTKNYDELQLAVYEKTFDIEIDNVLFDSFNFDKTFYRGWDHNKPITFTQRKFKQMQSQLYKNILYQKHIYEVLNATQCPNLIQMHDSFCVNSCLQQQLPFTYFFIFENLDANLSDIIRYRRENNCQWYVTEFQKLCWDLVSALDELHQSNITHNDIRPFNVHYSIQKQCYVLAQFSNALKTDPQGNYLNVKTRVHPSFIIPQKQLNNCPYKQVLINHKRADIYSLGMTLLCAFYMTQPVQRKLAAPINRKMEEKYQIMKIIRKMIQRSQYPLQISQIKQDLSDCNKNSNLKNLIESINFRQKPKTKQIPRIFIAFSSAYKRLGLWQKWRYSLQTAYETADGQITSIQEAEYCRQLARVQKLLQNFERADKLGQKAANLYYSIGSKYIEEESYTEAYSAFNNGTISLSYCIHENKLVLVKILQGLSILHFQKHQITESLACLKQSKILLKKTSSQSISDFYQIMQKQAQIHQLHVNFLEAKKVLQELLSESINQNDEFKRIQFLKKLGINSLRRAQHGVLTSENKMATQKRISSPLKHSRAMRSIYQSADLQVNQEEQSEDFQKQEVINAEEYFQQALQLIHQRFTFLKGRASSLTKSRSGSKSWQNQFQVFEIEYQNLQMLNLQILKLMGEIKFKQQLPQRAEDYFFKILAQIEKLTQKKMSTDSESLHNPLLQNFQNEFINTQDPINQMDYSSIDSRKYDFSDNVNATKMVIKSVKSSQKSIIKLKRFFSPSSLLKIKADVECSIALCKQNLKEYKQMLNYFNKSLSSYKNYFGQYHNKLCGIIIGSMAVGYQKTNLHNKALSCIQLAREILRDIQPANSPDLKHFQRVRKQIIKEQSILQKKIQSKSHVKIIQSSLTDILSSTIGLKNRLKKKVSFASNFSIGDNQSNINSMESLFNLKERFVEDQIVSDQKQEIQSEAEYQSDSSVLKQIQMPVKVSYYKDQIKPNQN